MIKKYTLHDPIPEIGFRLNLEQFLVEIDLVFASVSVNFKKKTWLIAYMVFPFQKATIYANHELSSGTDREDS